jgi:hypothetical protein
MEKVHPRAIAYQKHTAPLCICPIVMASCGRDVGSVMLMVPPAAVSRIPSLIRMLDGLVSESMPLDAPSRSANEVVADTTLLREWSLSQSTIEECVCSTKAGSVSYFLTASNHADCTALCLLS